MNVPVMVKGRLPPKWVVQLVDSPALPVNVREQAIPELVSNNTTPTASVGRPFSANTVAGLLPFPVEPEMVKEVGTLPVLGVMITSGATVASLTETPKPFFST